MNLKNKSVYIIALSFIIALVLFIWGFNFLKGKDVFSKQRIFYASYYEVGGLVKSNPVMINGLRVGQVKDLYFHPDNQRSILVELSLNTTIPIPANSISRIFSSDLMGSKAIDLQLGDSDIMAIDGDTLQTSLETSLKDEVNAQVAPLKNKAEDLLSSLDSLVMVIQTILNENAKQNIMSSLQNISNTFKNLENTTANIDTMVVEEQNRIASILYNIELITRNFEKNSNEFNRIIGNMATFSDSLVASDLPGTVKKADETLAQLSALLATINRGEGSLGMLVHNDTLYIELERTAAEMNKLLEDIRLNPKRYVKFSLF